MSWLMSAKRRAREGLLQAVGAHHATEDVEFDQKLRNFTDHVNHLQKVKDSMDLWIEAFDTFGAATLMLSESFKGFFAFKPTADYENDHPTSSPYLPVAITFAEIAKKLNRTILPSVRQLFEIRCLQPLAAILAMIGPIDVMIQERKSVLLDFDSYRAKIEKEHAAGRDSRHPLVIKKAMKLDDVAKRLHSLNTTIFASFVEFEKARSITLGPEFSAFMACFFHFSSYSTELSGKVVPHLPQIASSLYVLESFIGQSFGDLYTMEGRPIGSTPPTPLPVPAPASQNKFVKSSASTEMPSVVLERTEYAGGGYGGYATHTTVLPACYQDEAIGQMLAEAEATAAASAAASETIAEHNHEPVVPVPSVEHPLEATSAGSAATATDATTAVPTVEAQSSQSAASSNDEDSILSPTVEASFSGNFGASAAEESEKSAEPASPPASLKSEKSLVTPPVASTNDQQGSEPEASVIPTAPPVTPQTPSKTKQIPESVATTAPVPTPTPPPPAVKPSFFSSFFSSPSRAAAPVAKAVETTPVIETPTSIVSANSELTQTTEEVEVEAGKDTTAEVPLVEVTSAPPKPLKPPELSRSTNFVSNNRTSSPLPSGFAVSPEIPESGSTSPNPSFRNTISLSRGSVEGSLSADLTERRSMEASPVPAQRKPLKPPKPLARRAESNEQEQEIGQEVGTEVETSVESSGGDLTSQVGSGEVSLEEIGGRKEEADSTAPPAASVDVEVSVQAEVSTEGVDRQAELQAEVPIIESS